MESEKKQKQQRKEQIGDNLESEMIPMEHTERKDNKTVNVIKQTAWAAVKDLKEKITTYIEKNEKWVRELCYANW